MALWFFFYSPLKRLNNIKRTCWIREGGWRMCYVLSESKRTPVVDHKSSDTEIPLKNDTPGQSDAKT